MSLVLRVTCYLVHSKNIRFRDHKEIRRLMRAQFIHLIQARSCTSIPKCDTLCSERTELHVVRGHVPISNKTLSEEGNNAKQNFKSRQ